MASNPSRQRVSRAGIELIKAFEGFRPGAARLPGGRFVVGYGHVRSAREGVEISEPDAHALLIYDLMPVEAAVNEWVFAPLTQNQFDALVSFAFNIGVKAFRTSEVLRRVNEGALLQAAATLEMWRQADLDGHPVVIDALVRRRAAEKALFLTPPGGHVSASSAVLRPQLDLSARTAVPRERPEEVTIPLEGDVAVVNRAGPDGVAESIIPAAPEDEAEPEPTALAAAPMDEPAATSPLPAEERQSPAPPTPGELGAPAEPAAEEPPAPAPQEEIAPERTPEEEPVVLPLGHPSPEPDAPAEEEDGEDWSAARAAAAAVSARLHAILNNDDFVSEDEISPAESGAPPRAEPTSEPQPEPEPLLLEAEAGPQTQSEAPAYPRTDDVLVVDAESDRPVIPGGLAPSPSDDTSVAAAEGEAGHPPTGPYLLLGLVGLLFIVGALVVLFRSPPAAEEGQDGAAAVAWVLALLGVAGVSGALWFALRGEEDEDQPL